MSSSVEQRDPIAIIGMAARLPGAATVTDYWRNLREGVESIVPHTREEVLAQGVAPVVADDPRYVRASAPLAGADRFDAAFFGLSTREASIMDPQHRVFIEAAYHALEDAGYDSNRYRGAIGLYAGCTMNTYLLYNLMSHAEDVLSVVGDLQTMIGNDKDYLATRVSHKLDLRGPSVVVQTACSTSLVAVHQACRALAEDDCDVALAGGSSVRLPHAAGYLANPGGTSSPDGHCRAFDADAGGSVVGSGVGVVVLKRLRDARRDGDRIHALIRGSAINNDGRAKASFTAPSVEGQSRAVIRALTRAGVSARDISLVEAHGTGTPLGDPMEVAALTRGFRHWTEDTGYCLLGSVKPNIGHLDAAAGVAGLIKTVLALEHRRMPPVVNFRRANPKLNLEASPFVVPAELTALEPDRPLLASVNSLAMGGTNAHVVLETAPARPPAGRSTRHRHPVLLSARSSQALETLSQSIGQWAREHPSAALSEVTATLATGRPQWEHRRAVLARDLDDVENALAVRGSRRQRTAVVTGGARLAFLFPGQGAQRIGAGSRLAAQDPVFAAHLTTVLDLFAAGGIDLAPFLGPDAEDSEEARARLAATELTQPALFATEWALGRTLLDYGVRPYAMLGHSIGELVAATLAGVLALPDAVEVVAQRGRLMAAAPDGAMVAVPLAPEEVADRLVGRDVVVAAVNGPRLVSLSGTPDRIAELAAELRQDGVVATPLRVSRAFHSPAMDPAAAKLLDVLSGRPLNAPDGLVVSNVTGEYLTEEQATDPDYWGTQLRSPVRFADGVRTLLDDGVDTVVEVGPGRTLLSLVRAAAPEVTALAGLAGEDGREAEDLLDVLTSYWLAGGEVDWTTYYRDADRHPVRLPLYPFARTRHWVDPVRTDRPGRPAGVEVAAPGTDPGLAVDMPAAPPTGLVPQSAATVATQPGQTPAARPAAAGAAPAARPPSADGVRRTPMQRYLTAVWFQLLGTPDIGLRDNFFDLGGHSLLVMQMVAKLRSDGAGELDMTEVMDRLTVTELADLLESAGVQVPVVADVPGPAAAEVSGPAGPGEQAELSEEEAAELLDQVDSMSDDEVRALLARMGEEHSGE